MTVRHEIAPLVEDVLKATAVTIPLTEDSFECVVAFGFVGRCRRLLQALMHLDDCGLRDAGDGLVRSIYEYTTTGAWLLDDPEANVETFLRAHLRDLRLMSETRRERYAGSLADLRAIVARDYGDPDSERKLPPLEQRGSDIYKMRYWAYRELSTRMHPGLLSAIGALDDASGGYRLRQDRWPEYDFELGYLPYAGLLFGGYAATVFQFTHPEEVARLIPLLPQFVTYFSEQRPGWWILG